MKSRINRWCFSLMFISLNAMADMNDISRIYHKMPELNRFETCQGGGCYKSTVLSISQAEWQRVRAVFNPSAQNSTQERAQIARAIGVLEEIIGGKNGTASDRAGTFDNSETPGQLDCNDEAINTTTYLRLLKSDGLIKFHEAEDMRTRNFFFTGWPHTTAVMHELDTGVRYAVDSWFYDNGHAATIVPFAQWKANYQPEDSPIGKAHRQP